MSKQSSNTLLPRVKLNYSVVDMKESQIDIARKVFRADRTKCLKYRRRQLKNLLRMYEEHEDEMYEALCKDLGKHKQEASVFEIEFIKNDLLNVLYNLTAWTRPEARYRRFMNFFDTLRVYKDPYGVVLLVGAWNYPIQSTLYPLASAIAAGNCVILKPSLIAGATAEFIAKTLPNYLDNESYHVCMEDNFGGLLENRFDYIFYTGQVNDARIIHTAAAKCLTPTTLVIGGKNPVYLDESANLEMAARRILWGKCVNAGQTCIGPEYILCTREVEEKFIKIVPKILLEFYGDNIQDSSDFGRMISQEHFQKVVNLLKGKNIAFGGSYDEKTRFVHPTILTDVSPNDEIMYTETYGPILPIIKIKNIHEAITFINAREKPLALYIFSKRNEDIDLMLKRTSSGGVSVNDTLLHIAAESLPFGGVGNSGMGRYHGKYTFDTFTHEKSVLKKPMNLLVEKIEGLRYPPYNRFKLLYIQQAMKKWRPINLTCLSYLFVFLLGMAVAILYFIFN